MRKNEKEKRELRESGLRELPPSRLVPFRVPIQPSMEPILATLFALPPFCDPFVHQTATRDSGERKKGNFRSVEKASY